MTKEERKERYMPMFLLADINGDSYMASMVSLAIQGEADAIKYVESMSTCIYCGQSCFDCACPAIYRESHEP